MKRMKSFLGLMLILALVLSLVSGVSLTVQAKSLYGDYLVTKDDDAEALQKKVVKFNGVDWYIIADDSADKGTVTLFAKNPIGAVEFHDNSNVYSTSTVKNYLDNLTTKGGAFAGVADAIEPTDLITQEYNGDETYDTVKGAKLYLLSKQEAEALNENVKKCNGVEGQHDEEYAAWWLRSPGHTSAHAAIVSGVQFRYFDTNSVHLVFGVRPALKLNVESVIFSSESHTFSVRPTYEVTYKIVGGTWSDDSTADKKETVKSGLKPSDIPTGMKAGSGYVGGVWNENPSEVAIMGMTTFTYTFTPKQTAEETTNEAVKKTVEEEAAKKNAKIEVSNWKIYKGNIVAVDKNEKVIKKTGIATWRGYSLIIANGVLYKKSVFFLDKTDGKYKYFVNGIQAKTGDTFVNYGGKLLHVINGELNRETGFVRYGGKYVLSYQGVAATSFTGIINFKGHKVEIVKGVVSGISR